MCLVLSHVYELLPDPRLEVWCSMDLLCFSNNNNNNNNNMDLNNVQALDRE